MAEYVDKLQKKAAEVMDSGEALVAAVRAMSKGGTKAIVLGTVGAVLGGASVAAGANAGNKAGDAARDQAAAAKISHATQVALGLTDRRLLIWSRGAFLGRAKDLIGEIALDRIQSIEGQTSGSMMTPDPLRVRLADGNLIEFEIVKVDGIERFVKAFETLER